MPALSRGRWLPLVGLVAALGYGCSDGEEGPRPADRTGGGASVGGEVASTVDGVAIRREDVRRVVGETGMDVETALRRLQELELLAGEAERRGLGEVPRVRRAQRQALVQRLLREAEVVVTPESISDQDIRTGWRTRRGEDAPAPSEEERARIRDELVELRRFGWVRELVARLEEEQGVTRHEAAIESATGSVGGSGPP